MAPPIRQPLLAALACATLCAPAACIKPKGGFAGDAPVQRARYPFLPERIEIHPLTRLYTDPITDEIRIEAHVELFDDQGDQVKGAGDLLLELYEETGPVDGLGGERQVERWLLNLSDPVENAQAYDRVTRTYRATLTGLPDRVRDSDTLVLRAQLTTSDGRRLSALHRIMR